MGINPQNPRSNFGVLEGEKLTVAVILGGGVGGWWVVGGCLSTTKGNQGGGEEGLVGMSWGSGFMGPGVERGCWMGLGGEWLWDGFWGWSLRVVAMGEYGEREREREGTQSSKPSLVEHNRLYFNTGTARGNFRAFILLDA
ncbi:unnamed protein product [Prunus armeniaca]|uniref:Uncharacterized protein n=1 Tax=Prunus armeniaca TaxID=36596 RepID=A0A6J5VSK4_PRUAR|nr:unnamed protein product [Prunus armeniaca]